MYIEKKTELMRYISKCRRIETIIGEIEAQMENLSLGDYAEKALNKPESDQEKDMLMREVSIMAHKVIGEIRKI